jgi:hypothetical protein
MADSLVALVWREMADAVSGARIEGGRFAATAAALRDAGLVPFPCAYAEEAEADVERRLAEADAALVWIDPIQLGRDRTRLDAMLRRVAARGVMVSAHPDTILAMGTKEVLQRTRALSWGSDVRRYASPAALAEGLAERLAGGAPWIVKRNRGQGGQGVWLLRQHGNALLVRPAARGAAEETTTLDAFVAACAPFFEDGAIIIDQPYQPRVGEGMVRCYMVGPRLAGFGHQAIVALHPPPPGQPADAAPQPGPRLYSGPDDPRFQPLRRRMEDDWVHQLRREVGLAEPDLPVLWDADFLLGPRLPDGTDTHVLCEINTSSVSPFPEAALAPLAQEVARRLSRRA